MSNINTVAVSGNLTADPTVKWTSDDGDSAIVELRMAVNRTRKNADGDFEDEVSYFDLTVFGKFAKLVDRKLRKGDAITALGRLEQQRWQNDQGENRSKVVIVAQTIDSPAFFQKDEDVKPKESGESAPAAAPAAAAKPDDDDIPF